MRGAGMFEEFAVWEKINSRLAIRYVGFRNLENSQFWIAYGNFVSDHNQEDEPTELDADNLICANATLDSFLNMMPSDDQDWKPSIAEALAYFRANNDH
ncbi:MAG: hypothetical protein EOO38_30775 [Cytophagaceae bacterium]|nr:MAG: hypothetical protein EOO38_30775 [Cytophagaceae bacterium]